MESVKGTDMGMEIEASSSNLPAEELVRRGGARPHAQGPASPAARPAPHAARRAAAGDPVDLSPEAAALVAELQARDADVRAQEAAHLVAAGGLAEGIPTFLYQQGPDGRSYAVGGEMAIDTAPVPGNPRATLAKARQIEAAALLPMDPSSQNESVASLAESMAALAADQLDAGTGAGAGSAFSWIRPEGPPGALLDISG
jgi:hypothetical protein